MTSVVPGDLNLSIGSLVLFERGGCSANNAAFNALTTTFPLTDDLICFCHLLLLVISILVSDPSTRGSGSPNCDQTALRK
jgi:hypothetical protein